MYEYQVLLVQFRDDTYESSPPPPFVYVVARSGNLWYDSTSHDYD